MIIAGSSLYNSTQLEDLGFNDNEPIKLTVYVGGFRKHGDKADDPRPSRITVSVEKGNIGDWIYVTFVHSVSRVVGLNFFGIAEKPRI